MSWCACGPRSNVWQTRVPSRGEVLDASRTCTQRMGPQKTCPAAGVERLHDVDCFLSQVAALHSCQSAAAEFINGQTR
jgi:hypothetical protein